MEQKTGARNLYRSRSFCTMTMELVSRGKCGSVSLVHTTYDLYVICFMGKEDDEATNSKYRRHTMAGWYRHRRSVRLFQSLYPPFVEEAWKENLK